MNTTCMEDNFGKHSFSYDARGNQIEEKLNDFLIWNASYNALGFLESMWFENKCKNFIYNGFGNRIGCCTISDGVTCGEQTFAYDITKEYQNLLSLKAENSWVDYLWDDGIIGEIENDRRQYYLHDELMSPQYVIQNRQMTAGIQYDTFGNIVDSFGEPPVFGFIGYQKGAGGFYHAEVREYSPKTGRFLNRDAFPGMIVLPLTLNAYVYSLNDPINYYDPSGYIVAWLAGGIIGAVTNVVTKVAGDIVNSVKSRKLQVSSWQSYVGTATGGFASGSILVVSGGNMKAAGAAGSAVETFVSEGLSMATGAEGYRKEDDYSWKNLVSNTAISAGEGLASGFVFGNVGKHIKIQGINKGRGSFQAVWKQVMTKASKGQIVNVTWKTIGKGAIAYGGVNFFDQIIQKGISEAKNGAEAGLRKVVTDLISEKPPAQRVFEEMAGRKYGDSKDNRPSSYLGGGTKMPVCLT